MIGLCHNNKGWGRMYSCDPHQWWTKNLKQTSPLTNLHFEGTPDKHAEEINEFFVSISKHVPTVGLTNLHLYRNKRHDKEKLTYTNQNKQKECTHGTCDRFKM